MRKIEIKNSPYDIKAQFKVLKKKKPYFLSDPVLTFLVV